MLIVYIITSFEPYPYFAFQTSCQREFLEERGGYGHFATKL